MALRFRNALPAPSTLPPFPIHVIAARLVLRQDPPQPPRPARESGHLVPDRSRVRTGPERASLSRLRTPNSNFPSRHSTNKPRRRTSASWPIRLITPRCYSSLVGCIINPDPVSRIRIWRSRASLNPSKRVCNPSPSPPLNLILTHYPFLQTVKTPRVGISSDARTWWSPSTKKPTKHTSKPSTGTAGTRPSGAPSGCSTTTSTNTETPSTPTPVRSESTHTSPKSGSTWGHYTRAVIIRSGTPSTPMPVRRIWIRGTE